MKRTITAVTTAVAGTALGLGALAAPASAAGSAWPTGDSLVMTKGVVHGATGFAKGNRHQLSLETTDSSARGYVRSYYCPSGASITATWVSSRCTYRGTLKIMNGYSGVDGPADMHWVSSTGRSATQKGYVSARSTATGAYTDFTVDLTVIQGSPSKVSGRVGELGDPSSYTYKGYDGWIQLS